MIPRPTLSNVPAALSVLGSTRNAEDGNASANVLISDNDNNEFSEGVPMKPSKEISRDKEKDKLSRRSFIFGEKEVQTYGREANENSQAEEDDDYMCLTSLLWSIRNGRNSKLELRIEFLNSLNRRIPIHKNLSLPLNSVPTASKTPFPPTRSPHAGNLDSTHSRDSDTSTHTLQISSISSADLLPHQFQVLF
jgi:hypothetical protein